MNPAGDFEIINVLNPKSKSDLFLVKKIATEELFVWRTIPFKNISKEKKEYLFKKIRKRIQQDHVLLVKFHPAIEEDKLKLVYVSMEYFPQGNLSDFIKVLKKSEVTHIPEEIIVKILFQLSILIKSVDINDYLRLENIYFDEEFNVKFMNFSQSCTQTRIEVKMCDIGIVMMQLCTLNADKLCNKLTLNKEYYSEEFINLMEMMLKDTKHATSNIDKVVTHPVIVLKTFKLTCGINLQDSFEVLDYRKKLDQLRRKESALQSRENKIERKEYRLNVREKKLSMNEKAVNDKLTQAELYLKRCKENRNTQFTKYENIDTSLTVEYDDIEDEDNVETSKKLDVSKIRHQPIARTLSERKVKFKGHSPLRKTNFGKTKPHRKLRDKEKCKIPSEKSSTLKSETNLKDILNTDRMKDEVLVDTRKSILFQSDLYEAQNENLDCRPIAWTEENKKHAFELLRIMNSNSEKQLWSSEVRHTFL